jgi:hypothetical protein
VLNTRGGVNWKILGSVVNFDKLLVAYLRVPFDMLKKAIRRSRL